MLHYKYASTQFIALLDEASQSRRTLSTLQFTRGKDDQYFLNSYREHSPSNKKGNDALLAEGKGFRTPGAVNPAVFKTAAIDHSAIPPCNSLPQRLSKMEVSCTNISQEIVIYAENYL